MKLSNKYDVTLNDVIRYALRPKHLIENNNDSNDNKSLIAGAAVCGFIAGFTGAILLTPESGAELRHELAQFFEETNEKLVQLASTTIHNAINTIA